MITFTEWLKQTKNWSKNTTIVPGKNKDISPPSSKTDPENKKCITHMNSSARRNYTKSEKQE